MKKLIAGIIAFPLACITLAYLASGVFVAVNTISIQAEQRASNELPPADLSLPPCQPLPGASSPIYHYTWSLNPEAEQQYIQGICAVESQIDRPLTADELQSLSSYYVNPGIEFACGSALAVPFILICVVLFAYIRRSSHKVVTQSNITSNGNDVAH